MGILADLLPLAAFFIGYKFGGILVATAAIMVAVPFQLLLLRLAGRRVENVHKATFALILVFGALTLAFRDGAFIQWKSTAINFGFAAALFISHKVFKRNLVSMMLSKVARMEERNWGIVSHMLASFFLFIAILNTVLIHTVSEEAWVHIKTFGYPALSILAVGLIIAFVVRRGTIADQGRSLPAESAAKSPRAQEE